MADVNYVIIPYEGNINPGDPTGTNIYLQATKEIYKETDKLDIYFTNSKEIIYHFLSLANKYGWVCLASMVETDTVPNNIFRVVE